MCPRCGTGRRGFYQSKMKELQYFATVTDTGKISVPRRMEQEVGEKFKGQRIEITFRKKKKHRSSEQNRYYWGVVIPYILEAFIELGNDLQEGNPEHAELIHDFLKRRFLPARMVADANSETIELAPSTAGLSTTEMMEYIDRVCLFAAESLNVAIPHPNEQTRIFE